MCIQRGAKGLVINYREGGLQIWKTVGSKLIPPIWKTGYFQLRIPYSTVNVDVFAQYIFSHISRRVLHGWKFDVSKNYNNNRINIINWYVCKNIITPISIRELDARKFSSAKISTFTVVGIQLLLKYFYASLFSSVNVTAL